MTAAVTGPATRTGRERVLAAAIETFAQGGYEGTSIRDIAEAAGLTSSLLFYHFKSKADLYIAVVESQLDRIVARLDRALAGATDAYSQLVAFTYVYLDCFIEEAPGLIVVNREYFLLPPDVGPPVGRRYHRDVIGRIEQILTLGVAEGRFRPLDAPVCAIAIDAILKSFLRKRHPYVDPALREVIAAQVLDYYVLGLLPEEEGVGARWRLARATAASQWMPAS